MLVRKSAVANLEVGALYVAFSGKSKMLSSNGDKGVFVIVEEVVGKDVKVYIPSLNKTMVLKRLDERQDAWMYKPDDSLQVLVKGAQKAALFPKFTQRMNDTFEGKEIKFKPDALYKHEREGEGFGQHFYRFRGEDDKMNTFNFAWIAPNTTPEWRIPRAQRMGIGAVEVALPPKPVSAEEETLIEFLGASIKEFNKKKKENSCASFAMLGEDGNIIAHDYQGACHADLMRHHNVHYVLSNICRRDNMKDEVLHKKYITYLTTESPFKDAFLVKNADWIWKNGYVLTGNVSAQMLCGACIATRQAWEYPYYVEAWMGLAEQGIPLNAAYIFGSYAVKRGDKFSFGAGGTGHTVFSLSGMEEEAVINFLDCKPVKENKQPHKENPSYNGVNAMWGKIGGKQASVFGKLRAIGGAGKYGASTPIEKTDCMEQAADIIEEWMKGAGV